MPRRQDPLSVKVMDFFRTAEISAAETVLQLAQDELRKRKGAPLALAVNKKKKEPKLSKSDEARMALGGVTPQ